MAKKLENIFPERYETLLAEKVIDCFKRDYEITKEPIDLSSSSLIASIQEEWQGLVENGLIELYQINNSGFSRVTPADVESKLPKIIENLVGEDYLIKVKGKYIWKN